MSFGKRKGWVGRGGGGHGATRGGGGGYGGDSDCVPLSATPQLPR